MHDGLKRRGFMALAALRSASPAPVWAAAGEKRLTFAPPAMPASLDPIATPSFATRTAAMAVFETLYGTDSRLNAMPQMVETFRMDDEGRSWLFQLRSGLLFHDGSKVTARDCVASLRRWMRSDRVGHALGSRLDVIDAPSDDTLTLRLGKPLRGVPLMLAKSQMSPPVIMPARFADTNTSTPVDQIIGSGPFRVANFSWRAGMDLELTRFERYEPRTEASSFTGGRRVALLDRVAWRTADDPLKALRDGSVDWVEWLPPDIMPDAAVDHDLVFGRLDEIGYYAMLRLNTPRGPTANQRIRQAILLGVDQTAVMETVFGANRGRFRSPVGLFPPDSEFVSSAGNDRIGGTLSPRAMKAAFKDAGYKGEPIIVVNPVDDVVHARMTAAVIDQLTLIGLTVEERKLDRLAFAAWRAQADGAGPPGAGDQTSAGSAWSAFCDSVPCADHFDCFAVSAGPAPAGGLWPGWPDDPVAARLREAWIDAGDLLTQRAIASELQARVFTTAGFVPLGQWFPVSVWRDTVTGPQKGCFPVFWDIARSS